MAKKGSRLREFEKNHRVLDITGAQEERRKKRNKRISKKRQNKPFNETPKDNSGETEVSQAEAVATENKRPVNKNVRNICILVSVVFILAVAMSVKNIISLTAERSELKLRSEELMKMKEELTLELQNINSAEYIEQQARKELKLAKEDELIFYFPEDFQLTEKEEE